MLAPAGEGEEGEVPRDADEMMAYIED